MEFVVPKVGWFVVRVGVANCPLAVTRVMAVVPTPPTESVTSIERFQEPVTVDVPEITPVLEFRLRPVGSVPALTDQLELVPEPPVAESVSEYATPLVAVRCDRVGVEIVGAVNMVKTDAFEVTLALEPLAVLVTTTV
jgi:hypothetical protein